MTDSDSQLDERREEIAIIGMACRFPGARNPDEFWQNLRDGVESTRPFSQEELKASGVDEAALKNPLFVNVGAVVDDADAFDASFFGIQPREAEIMDPQHRVFLECAWEALENAGYDPETFDGLIGVFAGTAPNTYFQSNLITRPGLLEMVGHYPTMIGSEKDYLVTRVSFKLNLKGPSLNVNTACSTSGVAIHLACQSVLSGECDMALAGGVRIKVPLKGGYFYQEGGILSPDGDCRAFDEEARGTAIGNGVGIIVVKRLSDAIRDGDTIHAVIKGSAINNDGSLKVGFTAPSMQGQATVVAEAFAISNVSPDTIGYVEAHGTGTSLGDPIEVAALTKAFREGTNRKGFCPIGSVKTNIGHLDAGAGVAGIIKTALALKHKQVPPSLNFRTPNPQIDFDNSPFYVNTKLTNWKANTTPRRAGVSSFGLGGTNAHIVLEEAPEIEPSAPSRPRHLLLLSAKTRSALDTATANLFGYLTQHPDINIGDVAYTLQTGRKAFSHRRFAVCSDSADAVQALESMDTMRVKTRCFESGDPSVAFMFPGQGAQYVNMGLNLYEREPVFREVVDQCAEILEPIVGRDLCKVLYPKDGDSEVAAQLLRETRIQQPAIFTIEYAMAKLWNHWGVYPTGMIGHSIGEFVAACLAGVFSLEDALMLVATRGRMMQNLPEGAMLSVRLPAEEVEKWLSSELSMAAVNAPSLCVVSGPTEVVAALQSELEKESVISRRLHTSHAFHSPMMDPIVEPFAECVRGVHLSPPLIPFVTTVTGRWITPEQATEPEHWARHLRTAVCFAEGVKKLWEDTRRVLLEVGPRTTTTTLALQEARDVNMQLAIPSLGDSATDQAEWTAILSAVGQLWLTGVPIDWASFYAQENPHRVPLPTYPFERKRFWVEPAISEASTDVKGWLPEHQQQKEEDIPNLRVSTKQESRKERFILILKQYLEKASGRDLTNVEESMSFLEMGFDSLFLTQWAFTLRKRFGAQISVGQLLDDLSTLGTLAEYLDQELSPEAFPSRVLTQESTPEQIGLASSQSFMMSEVSPLRETSEHQVKAEVAERLVAQQLQLMSQQIEMLRSVGSSATLEELFASFATQGSVIEQQSGKRAQALDQSMEAAQPEISKQENVSVVSAEPQIKTISRDGNLPLSFAQQRLWYLDQLVPNTPVYNLPEAFRLTGRLDIGALKRSLNEIARRHEALRTTFGMNEDMPVQIIASSFEMDLPLVDLMDRPAAEREVALAPFLETESGRPFDLAEGPLVRAILVKLTDEEHVLFFMPHHCVFDGWSFGIFQRELIGLYEAFVAGKPSPLAELAIQYADFAAWQRQWLQGAQLERQLSYWQEQLGGELPVLEMPTDHPRPAMQSLRGSREVFIIPKQLVESLKALGRSEGSTLFMVLLAAFKTLLYRYTRQKDIIVGTPVAGRMRPETEDLIGFFVNTLVLRTSLHGAPSFRELLRRVRGVCLGAYDHQDMPFERLVEELQPERDLSRTPLYQALLGFGAGMMDRDAKMAGVSWSREKISTSVAQTDLNLWIMQRDDGLSAELEYCTDLFDSATIVRLLKHLQVLLEGIVADADLSIAELPLLTKPELQQQAEWNATETDYPQDAGLHQLFEAQVERAPDAVAVVFEGTQLTYRQLNQRANQLAHYLQTLGVGPDVLVGIFMERSAEMLVGLFGILKAGGAYVPLDPDYPRERLAYMMEDAQVQVLVTQQSLKAELPENTARVVCLDTDWGGISQESEENPVSETKSDNVAYVIYTSGSTGKPKGIQVPHEAVVNFLTSMSREPGLTENDVLLAVTTLSFDIHVLEVYLPLILGAKAIVVSREVASDGAQLLEALTNSDVTVMQGTPSTWRLLLAAGWKGSEKLKVLCGGEAFPRDLASELVQRAGSVWNMYGPTETTVWSTCYQLTDADGQILIGRPIANTTVYILDSHMQPVPVGVPGELYIGGAGVTRGYLNRPDLTEKQFEPDPFSDNGNARLYKTGDLARYHPDGNLEYLNRIDNQVKVRGFRIELGEIEAVLTEPEAVKQGVVVVREFRPGDTRLVAYIVGESGKSVTATELRKHLRTKLPEYMIPQHFVELDALPLTPAGKIDRKGLAAAFKIGPAIEDEYIAPRNETEQLLASIWQEVLGLDRVSVHDNFFEIGGHSILSMQVIARIKKETGLQLSPRIILLNTLGQIAEEYPLKPSMEEPKLPKDQTEQLQIPSVRRVFQRIKEKFIF